MSPEIVEIFGKIAGQPSTRKEVGSMRSLSIGFGDEAAPDSKIQSREYRFWEMGTYGAAWRITHNNIILLSKDDLGTDIAELDARLQLIDFGRFSAIQQLSAVDLRVEFDNGLLVYFTGDASYDDEYFHLFYQESLYVEFSKMGWKLGRSDKPWPRNANAIL